MTKTNFKNLLLRSAIAAVGLSIISGNVAYANDYYASMFNNRIQHSVYLKIPFHQDKFAGGDAPLRFGYSADFRRNSDYASSLNINATDLRTSLVGFEFNSFGRNKINFGGMPLGEFDRTGLYLGQDGEGDSEGGNSQAQIIAVGVVAIGGAFFATKSTTKTVPAECASTPVPGTPSC